MTGLTRDMKVINNKNIDVIKRTAKIRDFHKRREKSRDYIGEELVASRRFTLTFSLASAAYTDC
jgi:hypothetical protein